MKLRPHQGSALGLPLFIMLMEYVIRMIPIGKSEKLLYADDIAIKISTREACGETVNQWCDHLNWHRMTMNMSKTEV